MATVDEKKERLKGCTVVAFESRMAKQLAHLVAAQGGTSIVAPAVRELPLEDNPALWQFYATLASGKIDLVLFLTGVGTRQMVKVLEARHTREAIAATFSRVLVAVRGPKPLAACRSLGIRVTTTIPEPNTWREILQVFDREVPVKGLTVAVQEYGVSNQALLNGLTERGATAVPIPVYRWALPETTGPLREAAHCIAGGGADFVIFTSAVQLHHLMQIAREEDLESRLTAGLGRAVVASIGPTMSEALHQYGVAIDLEAEIAKLAEFIDEVGVKGRSLLAKKGSGVFLETSEVIATKTPDPFFTRRRLQQSLFLKACRREPTAMTPIWIMRQAGRYMKEYQEVRAKVGFLDLCKDSDLAAQVSVVAVEKLGVDAAIIFSDILLLLEPMGVGLKYEKDGGPVIHRPVRSGRDIDRLKEVNPHQSLEFVYTAIRKARAALSLDIPLIGFGGAPFTLASYLIEGRGSKNFALTKGLMHDDPGAWHALLERIVPPLAEHLNRQANEGAQALQIFDSWVGCLAPEEYREFVLPHAKKLFAGLNPEVPVIHFGTANGPLLELMRAAGGTVIGLDWKVDLAEAWSRLGPEVGVQGNLDPNVLLSSPDVIRREAKKILDRAAGRPGHIFNLGHGVLPATPIDNVIALVEMVHEMSVR